VVEDEALIRMDVAEMIRGAGFGVLEAANADEAITILEARLDITVVFTDVQMKLAAAVRHRWPPIKIIATSGNVKVSLDDLPRGGQFLSKPYTRAQIIQTIEAVAA
jgi:CheY-like chemotaxis protein